MIDTITGIIGFPFWWYTRGLMRFLQFVWSVFLDYRASLGIGVWVKNIFVPMYGSYDIPGRIISFFMRLAMIVLRGVALVFLALLTCVAFLAYLGLPILVAFMILYHALGDLL